MKKFFTCTVIAGSILLLAIVGGLFIQFAVPIIILAVFGVMGIAIIYFFIWLVFIKKWG